MESLNNMTFGLTMIIVGMGGTLLTLWTITLLITCMKKIFPAEKNSKNTEVPK